MAFDGELFGQQMADMVRDYVVGELAPLKAENAALRLDLQRASDSNAALVERIAALEARELPEAIKGDPGEVDMEAVGLLLDEKLAAIPAPEPAAIDMDAVAELIDKAVAERPLPENGKDCDMDAVATMLAELIENAVKTIPTPKDGVGLADALKNQDGELILVLADGRTKNLGKIDGEPGKDGRHGLAATDFDITVGPDGRCLEFSLEQGDTKYIFDLAFPFPLYRGVYEDGREYDQGDMVTWAGSCWHCNARSTTAKPGAGDDWQLAVKAGRAGKDAAK